MISIFLFIMIRYKRFNSNIQTLFTTNLVMRKPFAQKDSQQFNPFLYEYSKTRSNSIIQSQLITPKEGQSRKKINLIDNDSQLSLKINTNQNNKFGSNSTKDISPSKGTSKSKKAVEMLQKIQDWRLKNVAPVDLVGCERLHDQSESIQVQKYQILIALILSVQTKDEITASTMSKLKQYGLNPEKISKIKQQDLCLILKQSNFHKKKAKNIIQVSKRILQKGLPRSMEQLTQYPGVGIKIATLYMRTAEGINQGIGVDTHVHRISNRLGWVKDTKNPNQTEVELQTIFPKQYWNEINIAIVGFGQTLCSAKRPKCGQCPIKKECPYTNSILKDTIQM